MAVHLVKMAVGVDDVAHLQAIQDGRRADSRARGDGDVLRSFTRNTPKRAGDLLDGGSLYWVIRKVIRVRQRVLGVDRGQRDDGRPLCILTLDPQLVPTRPRPMRAFQGWRYLEPADAPPDNAGTTHGEDDLPEAMAAELRELGLL